MVDLLPCPFCGSPCRILSGDGYAFVECDEPRFECNSLGPLRPSAADAADAWNRHTPDPRIAELEARANEYAAEAQRMTEAADKDTWRANAAEIARDEAIARAEKAEAALAAILAAPETVLKPGFFPAVDTGRPYYRAALRALTAAHEACIKSPDRDVLGLSNGPFSGVNEALGIIAALEDTCARALAEIARLRAEGTFNEGIEAAAAFIEATAVLHGDTIEFRPRTEGDRNGLAYVEGIRSLRRPETGGS